MYLIINLNTYPILPYNNSKIPPQTWMLIKTIFGNISGNRYSSPFQKSHQISAKQFQLLQWFILISLSYDLIGISLQCFGRLRFHPKALMFKSQSSGKIDQFGSADICETHWMRLVAWIIWEGGGAHPAELPTSPGRGGMWKIEVSHVDLLH